MTFSLDPLQKGKTMTESAQNDTVETGSTSTTCSTVCQHAGRGFLLRTMIYAPIVLLVGAYAAVGMFPELAEYATPLLQDGMACYSTSACQGQRNSTSASCSSHGCPSKRMACCSTNLAAEDSGTDTLLTGEDLLPVDDSDEPADAFSVLLPIRSAVD